MLCAAAVQFLTTSMAFGLYFSLHLSLSFSLSLLHPLLLPNRYPSGTQYIIPGKIRRVKVRLPGFACVWHGSTTVNTTHDLSGHLSIDDYVKVGGQTSVLIDDPTNFEKNPSINLNEPNEYYPSKGTTHTYSHRLLLNRAYQDHRVEGCGLALFTTMAYGSGITGRVSVVHQSRSVSDN